LRIGTALLRPSVGLERFGQGITGERRRIVTVDERLDPSVGNVEHVSP
jgi:hypothetical protein